MVAEEWPLQVSIGIRENQRGGRIVGSVRDQLIMSVAYNPKKRIAIFLLFLMLDFSILPEEFSL